MNEAAGLFICFDKCRQRQMLIDAVMSAKTEGHRPKGVDHETPFFIARKDWGETPWLAKLSALLHQYAEVSQWRTKRRITIVIMFPA